MPIDEDNLNKIITDLEDKIQQSQRYRELHQYAKSIALKKVSDPTEKDPQRTKLVLPLDAKLGVEITEDRRQAIYDKLLEE